MTPDFRERYSRQIRLSGIGETGQQRLSEAHVVVIGCGALGTFSANALARAGVGRLTLVDRDYVEWSNLPRQWLFTEADAEEALPKAAAAARALGAVNSVCRVSPLVTDVTPANIEEACEGGDLILDGTDNFETRYLVNDYCVANGIPWIYGGAVGTYGISMPVVPETTACFACVYPDPPGGAQPTCETAGVLNVVTSAVASFQAGAAIRMLTGGPEQVAARITMFDMWAAGVRQIAMPERDPGCPACGTREFRWLNARRRTPVSLCGRNAVQIHDRQRPLDLQALSRELAHVGPVRANDFALRVSMDPYEMTIFPDGRAIIKGTTDVGVARSLYSRYIGN